MDDISILMGLTLTEIVREPGRRGSESLTFKTSDRTFVMNHCQDCCEDVHIEDICGELSDLIGSPITLAEESTNKDNKPDDADDEFIWTFYRLGTAKGTVVIRWYGSSNGYYGVDVDVYEKEMK